MDGSFGGARTTLPEIQNDCIVDSMTNLFTWNDSLGTGFEDVDLQHKKLILIIEDVHAAIESPADEYAVRMAKDLKRLTDYTQYHFGEEESFMRKYDYPGFPAHKKEHDAFIAQVNAEIKSLRQADSESGFRFYRFLGSWLLSHIAKSDQEWAAYIKGKTGK